MNEQYIQTLGDLTDWFHSVSKDTHPARRARLAGVLVTAKIRREWMTSTHQNKYIMNGKVTEVEFENLSGGVWKVTI